MDSSIIYTSRSKSNNNIPLNSNISRSARLPVPNMNEGISITKSTSVSNVNNLSNTSLPLPIEDLKLCKFMMETQADNIKALEKTINELKMENLQLIPLRYTIYKYKSQLEEFHSNNSHIQKEMIELQLKNEVLIQRNRDVEAKCEEFERHKCELENTLTDIVNSNKSNLCLKFM